MNILIDQATAEVVHIDLGAAFEQGLMLKTPERVSPYLIMCILLKYLLLLRVQDRNSCFLGKGKLYVLICYLLF